MNEFRTLGRRLYYFTFPNGTYYIDKPKCCRRLFKETSLINKAKSFSKIKTANASLVAWELFMKKNITKEDREDDSNINDEIEELLKDF